MKVFYKALIPICIVILIIVVMLNNKASTLNNEEIQKFLEETMTLHLKTENNLNDQKVVLISISDGLNKASVYSSYGNDYNLILNTIIKRINREYKNEYKYIRVDYSTNIKEITSNELNKIIKEGSKNNFGYNLLLKSNNNYFALLKEELLFSGLIDFGNNKINKSKLSDYVNTRDNNAFDKMDKIFLFESDTYFYDVDKKQIVEFSTYDNNVKLRKNLEDFYNHQSFDLASIANMENLNNEGTFIYQYNPIDNTIFDDYSIIRHSLGAYAIAMQNKDEYINTLDKKIDYIIGQIVKKDENTYFIKEEGDIELKLGANAVAVLALCEYYNCVDNSKKGEIKEYIKYLCNGILSFLRSDNTFNHELNKDTFTLLKKFRVNYYDGEAILALCKAYKVTGEKLYLQTAQNVMDTFYYLDYQSKGDHWIEYALHELLSLEYSNKYLKMAIENAQYSINRLRKNICSYTDFECLVQLNLICSLVKINEIGDNIIVDNDLLHYKNLLYKSKLLMANSYFFPEIAMFLDQPQKYNGLYFVREDNYRIRIDDIAHSIIGFYYNNNLDKGIN